VGPHQQENTHFSMERVMIIMNLVQIFFCQQLRGMSLLVLHNTERSLVSYHCSDPSCPIRG
jgi:hypothetical protein